MKIKDHSVLKQLYTGMITMFVLALALSLITTLTIQRIWNNAEQMFFHPFTVTKTIAELQSDVFHMRMTLQKLTSEPAGQDIQDELLDLATYQQQAQKQIETIQNAYLGQKADTDQVIKDFTQCVLLKDEAIRLHNEGRYDAALAIGGDNGTFSKAEDQLFNSIDIVRDFADNKAATFYNQANSEKIKIYYQISIIIGVIVFVLLLLSILLKKYVSEPLTQLTKANEEFGSGNLDARCDYTSSNEYGRLSATFNHMAASLQAEFKRTEKQIELSSAMFHNADMPTFTENLLSVLMQDTGSQMGAVYILNEQKTHFDLFHSIGLNKNAITSFDALSREGELGTVLLKRQICSLNISDSNQFVYSSISGDLKAAAVLAIPIHRGPDVEAIISLASVNNYTEETIKLVNSSWSEITARFNNVLTYQKLIEFSEKLKESNEVLETQAKELEAQASELTEQNTELEMQKNELNKASQLKSTFLSNMSHELRTPLNSVIALASVLNRRLNKKIPQEEYSYIDIIERNGKHLLSLVNEILDLSRIEAGKEEITLSHFSLKELTDEIVEMLRPQADNKGIELIDNIPGNFTVMHSDRAKCRHIIQNILGNAVKFTKVGKVTLSSESNGPEICISVQDTGIGIAQDQLEFIFDEFRQADESTTREIGGTGLGLAIAKKYTLLLKGNIEVQSQQGVGTLFKIVLPLEYQHGINEDIHSYANFSFAEDYFRKQSIPKAVNTDGHLLLVEDSEPAVIQIKDILCEKGYKVEVARDGQEALEQMEEYLPRAIILDLMMPRVDGFKVLETLRSVKKTKSIPVLILTAKCITKDELKFLKENHVFQLIQKGAISKEELLSAVNDMTADRQIPYKKAKKQIEGKPKVLVIEDNPDNMTTVKAILGDGYDIVCATDGKSGLEKAAEVTPDVILLDISLPGMDGFKVLTFLKDDKKLSDIPVIALTAHAMFGDREELISYGFDGYVSKPIDENLLFSNLAEVLHAK